MHAPQTKPPAAAVWALGLTQVVGFGTLFYSFAILAPAISVELAVPAQWPFGALSVALLFGSIISPAAGRMADRFGAGRMMTAGSAAAALTLAAAGLAPERWSFATALVAMELASCFVLYATAFVAVVQLGPAGGQRGIVHLTLIGGFASTVFWPLTTALHEQLSWREVYLVFAALNLCLCLPIHWWIARLSGRRLAATAGAVGAEDRPAPPSAPPARRRAIFLLMLAGFAVEGFVLSAVLLHMVPLIGALGLGAAGVLVSTLFGPAQVASRLINMTFGGTLRQTALVIIAATLLPTGIAVALGFAPTTAGIAAFVILFGLGSGLLSIVTGTLPLEVLGREGYGASVGWMSAARQFTTAFAPFVFAVLMAEMGVRPSLGLLLALAGCGIALFALLAWMTRPSRA
ncbi:MAG: arsenite efflux MFS transporter ArsK [Rhizobiaceae bacterium]|nr:arsenite efflux MFS transporter ArsK [Rhizobiaceae bacterium]